MCQHLILFSETESSNGAATSLIMRFDLPSSSIFILCEHSIQKAQEALFKMSVYIITYRTIVTHKEGHFIKC